MRSLPLLVVSLLSCPLWAQPTYETALKNLKFRGIGPAEMGGRVDDLAIVDSDPRVMYVGAAAGGIFKSVNGGMTWRAIFEEISRIPPSATSPLRRRIPRSFTRARASRITGRVPHGATVCISRWTAAQPGPTRG